MHTDRRWRQAVKRSVPHGRSEEASAGIREFFKAAVHFRPHVWRGRDAHRPQGRKVLCTVADEYPGWPSGCIIMGWFRYFSGQPCSADGPKRIIELYAYRFSIEELFREFKQQIGGFAYHFWTKAVPKLNHFQRKGEADALATVHDDKARRRILSNIKAIEGFVLFASIAMGLLQLIALDGRNSRSAKKIRYLRTASRKCPSEATVMYYVRKNINSLLLQHPDSFITRFIRERQVDNSGSSGKRAA